MKIKNKKKARGIATLAFALTNINDHHQN